MNQLLKTLPRIVRIVLLGGTFNLDTISGFYGVLFTYVIIMIASHAIILGADIISKEEKEKTSEFLFVKPVSRAKIITSKLFAGVINILILNIITLLSSIFFCNKYGNINNEIIRLIIGMFFIQLIFFSIGLLISSIIKNTKSAKATGVSTGVLLILYVTAKFLDITDKIDFLKYLNPFKYFDPQDLIINGINIIYVILSVIIILVSIFLTYILYNKKDLNV